MRTRPALLVFPLLLALVLAAAVAPPAQAATGQAATVFSLTNQQRVKAGVKPLISDAALDAAAQAWAQHLASTCTFAHSTSAWRSARTSSAGWAATGENIAAGYSTPTSVMRGWMTSPGHKANILDARYTGVGVGFAKGTCYSTYWVQVFGWSKTAAAPGAGDVNGDFDADVLAQSASGQLIAYRGNGAGGWEGSTPVSTGWSASPRLVTLGDFTGDGVSDIGRIRADGVFELLKGTGRSSYGAPTVIGTGWAAFDAVVGGIDFNGDRRTDVLARTSSGALFLYRGNGSGGWLSGRTQVGSGWHVMTAMFYAGDFNGDATGDILARRADGSLWLYPTNGAGKWRSASRVGSGWNSMTAIFSPGDFDGSGTPDVLARRSDGGLMLYRGNGKGGWGAVSVVARGWDAMRQVG